ncbi:YpdA family putative bacillithiol disulfide reductase [Aquimarina agarilytica]|uniref:YpdA family putative bacillithiol disulfide reductase n=1 Tax=Aquimarina agarilytica TaxID=1087449 RepID=UPI000289D49C|nr:YpdA family putative bacillithiol disulfide reductase [Aquimarina agarilytica]
MENSVYDIIIIGAGPIGLCCAIEAQKKGLSALILEKGVLVNSIYNFPTNMTFFSTSKLLEIGDVPFISHNDKPTRAEALEYYRRVVDTWDLNVITFCEAMSLDRLANDNYIIETPKGVLKTKHVVVSTGFYDTARLMNVAGESLPKVKHFYDDAHPYVGKKVLVVGAANSACDIALELYHKNAEVTMVIRGREINTRVKYWIKPNIENRIKEGSIKAYFGTNIKEIKTTSVVLETPKGEVILKNDFVLAMTGYQPDYSLFRKLGIPISADAQKIPLHNEITLETSLPNVFVAGVIKSGMKTSAYFIENSRDDALKIIDAILTPNP